MIAREGKTRRLVKRLEKTSRVKIEMWFQFLLDKKSVRSKKMPDAVSGKTTFRKVQQRKKLVQIAA